MEQWVRQIGIRMVLEYPFHVPITTYCIRSPRNFPITSPECGSSTSSAKYGPFCFRTVCEGCQTRSQLKTRPRGRIFFRSAGSASTLHASEGEEERIARFSVTLSAFVHHHCWRHTNNGSKGTTPFDGQSWEVLFRGYELLGRIPFRHGFISLLLSFCEELADAFVSPSSRLFLVRLLLRCLCFFCFPESRIAHGILHYVALSERIPRLSVPEDRNRDGDLFHFPAIGPTRLHQVVTAVRLSLHIAQPDSASDALAVQIPP